MTESYFAVPKNISSNSTNYFIMKTPNKKELQQITSNDSSDIDFKDFINLYKKSTTKLYSFFVNNTTLTSDNLLRLRRQLLEGM